VLDMEGDGWTWKQKLEGKGSIHVGFCFTDQGVEEKCMARFRTDNHTIWLSSATIGED